MIYHVFALSGNFKCSSITGCLKTNCRGCSRSQKVSFTHSFKEFFMAKSSTHDLLHACCTRHNMHRDSMKKKKAFEKHNKTIQTFSLVAAFGPQMPFLTIQCPLSWKVLIFFSGVLNLNSVEWIFKINNELNDAIILRS